MEDLKTISFTISKAQLTDVERLKRRLDRDRSWVLRDLIRRGLESLSGLSALAESVKGLEDIETAQRLFVEALAKSYEARTAPDMDPADRALVEALVRQVE